MFSIAKCITVNSILGNLVGGGKLEQKILRLTPFLFLFFFFLVAQILSFQEKSLKMPTFPTPSFQLGELPKHMYVVCLYKGGG